MDDNVLLKITKGELGLLYLAVCEMIDKKAGIVVDRNNLRHNQLIDLRNKLNSKASNI